MIYTDRFIATDNLILHLNTFVGSVTDPFLQANYAGFLSVSSITVYELAIKDIFCEFALKKNKVFGNVVESHFSRINGKIRISDLKGSHVKLFGDKYLKKFKKKLETKEDSIFASTGSSITSDYGNLVTCRHSYVHEGSTTLTIQEVIKSYYNGKEVINCLYNSMKR